ncbi:MAG: hypothetical protein QW320_12055 [Ignisphaera sp.]
MRRAFTSPPVLIWLISAMLVVGVALAEELEIRRKYRDKYDEYRRKTLFMIPLPGIVSKATKHPETHRRISKKIREIASTPAPYIAVLIAVSYVLMLMSQC